MFAPGATVLLSVAVLGQSGWSAAGGIETFTYRDVARSGPPVDASPVEWIGSGPSLAALYERANSRRAHRVLVDVAAAGSFEYAGPVRSVAAPGGDGALRVEGRYEYRRYLFGRRLPRGLDAIAGVQGMLRHLALTRTLAAARLDNTATSSAVAGVLGVRLQRWSRWAAELNWTNGAALVREHDRFDVDPLADVRLWGGAWLTDLSIAGAVRVASRAALTASFLRTGEGSAVSHHSYAFGRRRLLVGVTYAR
jgi:hypothetical protein